MIEYLNSIYPGWRRKLVRMTYSQVHAIYMRFIQQADEARRHAIYVLEYRQWLAAQATQLKVTDYYCDDCARFFEADNPELQACMHCDSHRIRRIIYD